MIGTNVSAAHAHLAKQWCCQLLHNLLLFFSIYSQVSIKQAG